MIKIASKSFIFVVFILQSLSGFSRAEARSNSGSRVYVSDRSGVLLDFGLHYGQSQAVGTPATQDFKGHISAYDSKLGYIGDHNWYLGLLYSVKNHSTSSASTNGTAQGAGFGYFFRNNFNFRTFYRHDERFGHYRQGTGFQADLEYKFLLGSRFYLGVLMSHRQVRYKVNSTTVNYQPYTAKETFPMVSIGALIN